MGALAALRGPGVRSLSGGDVSDPGLRQSSKLDSTRTRWTTAQSTDEPLYARFRPDHRRLRFRRWRRHPGRSEGLCRPPRAWPVGDRGTDCAEHPRGNGGACAADRLPARAAGRVLRRFRHPRGEARHAGQCRGDQRGRRRAGTAPPSARGSRPGNGRHQRRTPAGRQRAAGAARTPDTAGHADHPQHSRSRAAGRPQHRQRRPRRAGRRRPARHGRWRRAAEGRPSARRQPRGRSLLRWRQQRRIHPRAAAAGRARHRLHAGLGHCRPAVQRAQPGQCLRSRHRLRGTRPAAGLRARPQRGAGA